MLESNQLSTDYEAVIQPLDLPAVEKSLTCYKTLPNNQSNPPPTSVVRKLRGDLKRTTGAEIGG